MRKSIPVADLLEKVNTRLAAPGGTPEGRRALAEVLETVLHSTGNYRGFRYIDGYPCADESRVEYIVSSLLRRDVGA